MPATNNGFTAAVDNTPLHALSNAVNGGNGVYAYAANSTFPSQTFSASNYWVDPVFVNSLSRGHDATDGHRDDAGLECHGCLSGAPT